MLPQDFVDILAAFADEKVEHLIVAKRAAGRPQDKVDADKLSQGAS